MTISHEVNIRDDEWHECPTDTDEVDARLNVISAELAEIKETLDFIRETILKADTTITTVAAEVMPTINQLMENPMVKMLAGKKKT